MSCTEFATVVMTIFDKKMYQTVTEYQQISNKSLHILYSKASLAYHVSTSFAI